MTAEELKHLLIGKTIREIESCAYMDRELCVETITFTDGTVIEFSGQSDLASIDCCRLPGREWEAVVKGSKPPPFCRSCGQIDEELRRWWLELRDDGTKRDHVAATIEFVSRLGLLSDSGRELWLRRIATCPGHDDEGGRNWCAYCGDIEVTK